MKLTVFVFLVMWVSVSPADIRKDAAGFIPGGWVMDTESVLVADFNDDGSDDVALCYYEIDSELGEIENRINRVLVLLSKHGVLERLVDQGLPEGEDYGVPINLDWDDGMLTLYQHRGVMHQWNQWQLAWDPQREAFWERTSAWGGLMGFGSSGGFDAATGIGYVEKIWDDVDVSAEYLTVYASRLSGTLNLDGLDDERDWGLSRRTDTFWINHGENLWKGKDDAGLEVRALFDDTKLYLFIDVSDDVFVPPHNEDEVLNRDHLELWFDLFNWQEAESEGYIPELWQRKGDRYVHQVALAEDSRNTPLVSAWLPEGQENFPGIEAAFSGAKGRWKVELAIDWQSLGANEGPPDYLPLSVVYSDSDAPDTPRQELLIGTSQVRWADPFTFGSLVTSEPKRMYWGVSELPKIIEGGLNE